MLWKQKVLLGAMWALLSIGAVLAVYFWPRTYRAEMLILVDAQKIPESYVAGTVRDELQDRLATISQQILSSTRLQTLIDRFDLYREERKRKAPEEIIEMMRSDIQIRLEKGWTQNRPGAFRVFYQGPNPSVVADVANQIGNLFIDENLRTRETHAEGTTEFVEAQLNQAKKRLDEQEERLGRFKLQHPGELPQQENTLIATLSRLQVEFQGNQDAINRAQQNKLMLETSLSLAESSASTLAAAAEQAATTSADAGGPPPAAKPTDRAELLRALERARLRYTEEHPDVRQLQAEISRLDLAERDQKSAGSSDQKATSPKPAPVSLAAIQGGLRERERVANLKVQLDLTRRELETREKAQQRILRDIAVYQKRVEQLPVREQEIAAVTRDYEISKAHYRSLLDKKLSAEMSTEMERRQKGERFTVLDAARPPQKWFKPDPVYWNWFGVGLAMAIALTVALGRELKRNAFLGEWELPPDVAVLGRVPRILISTDSGQMSGWRREAEPSQRKWRVGVAAYALLGLGSLLAAGGYLAWGRF